MYKFICSFSKLLSSYLVQKLVIGNVFFTGKYTGVFRSSCPVALSSVVY